MTPAANTRSASRARVAVSAQAPMSTDSGNDTPVPDFHLLLSGGKRVQFGREPQHAAKRRRIYAPPPPRPWWKEPPRAAALYKRTDSCATCDEVRLEADCERCEKRLCALCTRLCDVCGMTWCTFCSLVDYDSPFERTLCSGCWEDAKEGAGENGAVDEDEDMISLE